MNNKNLFAVGFIFFITALIFFKIFTKGLYPVPGDLLVSFYFPYYSGWWEGYDAWTTHKEQFGADAIRQIYLWKEFAFNQFKNGKFPLWNPYTFSGQPLLANFQSSVYYPLNIFYFLTNAKNAWILLIVSQPLLGGLFMYLASRSFKLSRAPAVFAAVVFMFSSYLITWMENGNIAHSYIWFALAIWSINEYFHLYKARFVFALIFSLTMSILGGHPQTVIYLYITTLIYWGYKSFEINKHKLKSFLILAISFISPILISGIQVIPTISFYTKSPISLPFAAEIFDRSILPVKNLITFFAVDFFGNPASKNFWSQSYGDFTPYIGVIPIIFALWAIKSQWREKIIKFSTAISAFFIVAAVNSPITWAIKTFEIPLLNSTTPSRFVSISIFFLVILSAFGFQDIIKNLSSKPHLKKFIKFLSIILLIYLLFWIFAIFGAKFLKPTDTWLINLSVTRRNLIIPTLMFLSLPLSIFFVLYINKFIKFKSENIKPLFITGILTVTLYGGLFFSNKFLPMAPKAFFFPEHPLYNWIQDNAGIDRFYGQGTATIDFNMPIHYEVFVGEGYDTLRLQRYAELLAAGRNGGKIPDSYLRSDAAFEVFENGYRRRLFELLGVKYLLDKEDTPKTGADWHYDHFTGDEVQGYWQYEKFQVYKRDDVLPRLFLTTRYEVINDDNEIIDKIFDSDVDLTTIILEKEPNLIINEQNKDITTPQIISYDPNEVIISTNTDSNSLLFISDAYDEDWQVTIDNSKDEILRAHYALRAVAIPMGSHTVIFNYKPPSHTIGLYVTLVSLLIIVLTMAISIRSKNF